MWHFHSSQSSCFSFSTFSFTSDQIKSHKSQVIVWCCFCQYLYIRRTTGGGDDLPGGHWLQAMSMLDKVSLKYINFSNKIPSMAISGLKKIWQLLKYHAEELFWIYDRNPSDIYCSKSAKNWCCCPTRILGLVNREQRHIAKRWGNTSLLIFFFLF